MPSFVVLVVVLFGSGQTTSRSQPLAYELKAMSVIYPSQRISATPIPGFFGGGRIVRLAAFFVAI